MIFNSKTFSLIALTKFMSTTWNYGMHWNNISAIYEVATAIIRKGLLTLTFWIDLLHFHRLYMLSFSTISIDIFTWVFFCFLVLFCFSHLLSPLHNIFCMRWNCSRRNKAGISIMNYITMSCSPVQISFFQRPATTRRSRSSSKIFLNTNTERAISKWTRLSTLWISCIIFLIRTAKSLLRLQTPGDTRTTNFAWRHLYLWKTWMQWHHR